jgi:hypothetical protein
MGQRATQKAGRRSSSSSPNRRVKGCRDLDGGKPRAVAKGCPPDGRLFACRGSRLDPRCWLLDREFRRLRPLEDTMGALRETPI